MKFLKFIKLRKYVNGVPTDEYKRGSLLDIVESASQTECEKGK